MRAKPVFQVMKLLDGQADPKAGDEKSCLPPRRAKRTYTVPPNP